MQSCKLSHTFGPDNPAAFLDQQFLDHTTVHMCNSRTHNQPPPPVVEYTGESGGAHFEGIHHISLVMSSGATFAVIVFIAAWCLLRKKKNCFRENASDSPSVQIAMPSAPFPMTPVHPPNAPVSMVNMAPSMPTNPTPPTDIELALLRMQEKERLRQLHQQEKACQPESLSPGLQLALANRFPVV